MVSSQMVLGTTGHPNSLLETSELRFQRFEGQCRRGGPLIGRRSMKISFDKLWAPSWELVWAIAATFALAWALLVKEDSVCAPELRAHAEDVQPWSTREAIFSGQ